ncbi:hypothetical protein DPQ33_09100 [Oceanidesulfovibrio indonesiensis]|uniref:Uncharacterized protein n=1 Tax=Oceanidesulfovibrio indonesiensis TaxID=54767 RepID=A0A7M3MFP0_9BACT|nr:hypothetical protein DPQ33_09100 [Oceanidesulfovibrio indonesiensis]
MISPVVEAPSLDSAAGGTLLSGLSIWVPGISDSMAGGAEGRRLPATKEENFFPAIDKEGTP